MAQSVRILYPIDKHNLKTEMLLMMHHSSIHPNRQEFARKRILPKIREAPTGGIRDNARILSNVMLGQVAEFLPSYKGRQSKEGMHSFGKKE